MVVLKPIIYLLRTWGLVFMTLLMSVRAFGESQQLTSIPNLTINDFEQDKAGYMWIATDNGACRYSGLYYYHYQYKKSDPSSISGNVVHSIKRMDDDRLWFCSSGGVSVFDESIDAFVNCHHSSGLSCMVEVGDYVVCSGSGGMVVIDKKKVDLIHVRSSEEYQAVALAVDSKGGIWGMNNNGIIYKYDKNLNISNSFTVSSEKVLSGLCACCDDKDRIWFGTENGIVIIDSENEVICEDRQLLENLSSLDDFTILTLSRCGENIYIGTLGDNLHCYDLAGGTLNEALFSKSTLRRLQLNYTSDFSSCYLDKDGNLWIGTLDRGYGVDFVEVKDFAVYNSLSKATDRKYINAISIGEDNILWGGSKFKGILVHSGRSRTLKWYVKGAHLLEQLPGDNVNAIHLAKGNRLWLNLDENIVSCRTDGLEIMSYEIFPEKYVVNAFKEDADGKIWAATNTGVAVHSDKSFRTVAFDGLCVNDLILLNEDSMLAAVSGHGIYMISTTDFKIKPYIVPVPSHELYAPMQAVVCMMIDSQGTLWTGTQQGLVGYSGHDEYRIYTTRDGLYSDEIASIVEAAPNKIWMGTSYGLSMLDCERGKIITYLAEDMMQTQQFFPRCSAKSSGMLYFGGRTGMVQFRHSTVIKQISDRPVNLVINNVVVNGEEKLPMESFVLKHDENNLNINYEAIAFLSYEKINFAYRLTGKKMQDDWNYVRGQRNANYSHLSSGKYTFELIAQNPDGEWNTEPVTLEFKIKPSPFLTWYAILAYIIVLSLAVWFGYRFFIIRRLQRIKLRATQRELAMEKEFSKMKIDFFNNISHEMRTHLTMIYGPVNTLSDTDPQKNRQYVLPLMNYNIQQLLKLIDQTLGISRIEYGALPLSISCQDFPDCMSRLVDGFRIAADTKEIDLRLNMEESCRREIAIDYDIFFKVLSNLLSNAIKYAPEKGRVEIDAKITDKLPEKLSSAEPASNYLTVSVFNNGESMTDDEIAVIFDRFKRLPKNQHAATGSGLGLHFVNQLIKVHKGSVCAESIHGGGMCFSYALPVSENVKNDSSAVISAIAGSMEMAWLGNNVGRPELSVEPRVSPEGFVLPKILIAEDNPDLRMYYRSIFSDDFIILLAENGQEAMDMVNVEMPDIVIADIMMPLVNGYELCERIKGDPVLCHIPVVMLTAMISDNDKISGYQKGADVYITKPFNPNLLISVIGNLLKKQERIREVLLKQSNVVAEGESREDMLSPIDRKFVENLYMYIDEEISNGAINIDDISAKMCMSRASFYRKVKSLTGVSPNNFILIYRLNKSAEMIRSRQYRLNEVSDMLGFSSQSHFSRCFKNHFGVSPKDFE